MSSYASGTSVPAERSRGELEKLLRQHGATAFGYAWEHDVDDEKFAAVVMFRLDDRQIRMAIPMPEPNEARFTMTPSKRQRRTKVQAEQAYEQEIRRRWRSLTMVIKAKLVAIADGISSIEREFLADIVTEDGRTVGEIVKPHLASGGRLALTWGGSGE